jgi:hypothetical protein
LTRSVQLLELGQPTPLHATVVTPLTIPVIQKNLEGDRLYRERRHPQWTTNYELSRDTVITNRLTQRQSVNVPYMKETLKTYLSQTDSSPDLFFEEKGNDKQKELYINEYWADVADKLKLDILEEVDRKQEWLYGRSFAKLNILDGDFFMEILDPQDVLVDRYVNPWDIDSGRRVAHVGIYRTLSDLSRNPMYDKGVVSKLAAFFNSPQGLIVAGQNSRIVADRAQRLLDMGVPDVMLPMVGETYVELNELQVKVWDEAKQEDVVMVVVTGNSNEILMQKPMRDILGVNFFTICNRTSSYNDALTGLFGSIQNLTDTTPSLSGAAGTDTSTIDSDIAQAIHDPTNFPNREALIAALATHYGISQDQAAQKVYSEWTDNTKR